MIDKILFKVMLIVGALLIRRQIKKFNKLKGGTGMKVDVKFKGSGGIKVHAISTINMGDEKQVIPTEIMHADLNIEEHQSSLELSEKEFELGRTTVCEEVKHFRETIGVPLINILGTIADNTTEIVSNILNKKFDIMNTQFQSQEPPQ